MENPGPAKVKKNNATGFGSQSQKQKNQKNCKLSTEILMSGERRQQQRGQCERNPAKP
jgi:hypothetical protein